MHTTKIGDLELTLSEPVRRAVQWIGQQELLHQILACWTRVTPQDLPLTPRLIGKPGMGKTTLAQAAGQELGRPVYIFQCTMDTRPEDLLVTPVLSEQGHISYHGSSLVSAMLQGGVAILDEANRMPEKSWASLAPLLDHRRYVESVVAGIRIEAHPDFCCCVTMNDDASTYEVPEYMLSRIQPQIAVEFPEREEELEVLRYNVDFAPEDLLDLTVNFLQEAHRYNLNYSTRDGINIMRYSLKLRHAEGLSVEQAFPRAVEQVLGEGADRFEERAAGLLFPSNLKDLSQFMTRDEDLDDRPEDTGS
jgi:Mg-chelatase subunit ChlI